LNNVATGVTSDGHEPKHKTLPSATVVHRRVLLNGHKLKSKCWGNSINKPFYFQWMYTWWYHYVIQFVAFS